jgi:hypothetical protein
MIADAYRAIKESRMPVVGHCGYPTQSGKLVMAEFALFPLSTDGVVTQCLAADHLDVRAECLTGDLAPLKRRASETPSQRQREALPGTAPA